MPGCSLVKIYFDCVPFTLREEQQPFDQLHFIIKIREIQPPDMGNKIVTIDKVKQGSILNVFLY